MVDFLTFPPGKTAGAETMKKVIGVALGGIMNNVTAYKRQQAIAATPSVAPATATLI